MRANGLFVTHCAERGGTCDDEFRRSGVCVLELCFGIVAEEGLQPHCNKLCEMKSTGLRYQVLNIKFCIVMGFCIRLFAAFLF